MLGGTVSSSRRWIAGSAAPRLRAASQVAPTRPEKAVSTGLGRWPILVRTRSLIGPGVLSTLPPSTTGRPGSGPQAEQGRREQLGRAVGQRGRHRVGRGVFADQRGQPGEPDRRLGVAGPDQIPGGDVPALVQIRPDRRQHRLRAAR